MLSNYQNEQNFKESLQQSVSNNFGDFQVGDQINHGGYGHIFKLRDRKFNKIYALKVLDRTGKGRQTKIKNQIKIHQSLKNRYIIRLNNQFHDESNYYMVLHYCELGDLGMYMEQHPNGLPQSQIQYFAQSIAKGISYLHKQQILHGDIKPSNILIDKSKSSSDAEQREIKICDFGLSTKLKSGEKANGMQGSLSYLAPEIIYPYDFKVDIWAFGVMLYNLATAKLPFSIKKIKEIPEQLSEKKLNQMTFNKNISPKLADLLKHIFVYSPEKRYSINDILNHPFIKGGQLPIPSTRGVSARSNHNSKDNNPAPHPIKSYLSSNIDAMTSTCIKDMRKTTIQYEPHNQERRRAHSKQLDRRTSTTEDKFIKGKAHQNKMNNQSAQRNLLDNRLNRKKVSKSQYTTKMRGGNDTGGRGKQNYLKYANTKYKKSTPAITSSTMKRPTTTHIHTLTHSIKDSPLSQKQIKSNRNYQIVPLNTQNMVIKPIKHKNKTITIDHTGISIYKEEENQQQQLQDDNGHGHALSGHDSVIKTKLMRVSPNGQNILIRIGSNQKRYALSTLPQRYHSQYQNCRKTLNSTKDHTLKYALTNKDKKSDVQVMYSGKILADFDGVKIQTNQKALEKLDTYEKDLGLKLQIKRIIERLKQI